MNSSPKSNDSPAKHIEIAELADDTERHFIPSGSSKSFVSTCEDGQDLIFTLQFVMSQFLNSIKL